ncbi:MAG: hypothetical protein EON96_14690 [Caulobacteraceae bacterium]|nr:MAG: hypothetical protein EON96_14690 [Caulobacteraceae bacterium]
MSDPGKRLVDHWIVRLLLAVSLPAWILVLATVEHGSPSASAAVAPVLTAFVVVGALIGGGVGVWGMLRPTQAKARMDSVAVPEEPGTALQRLLGLIGSAAFLAGGYQTFFQFDVFSVQLERAGLFEPGVLTPWDTLLALCALQFVLFTADAATGIARRRSASSL